MTSGSASSPIPRLVPNPPSRAVQLFGYVARGVRTVTDQVVPYTAWWDDQNQTAATGSGPLLVALGDSTAIGIGASAPDRGYIGLLRDALSKSGASLSGESWRVVNLALSGARLQDALDRQVPVALDLAARGLEPDAVVCCIGTNDLVWGRDIAKLRLKLGALAEQLPNGSVVGTLAGASARGQLANKALRNAAAEHELRLVETWSEPNPGTGPRLAADRFHPNDLGYQLMVRPFAREFGVAGALTPLAEPDEVPGSEATER
ncbi:MAG: SGNH/GDSL hydrolase family protein [Acidimicrobiales bacterium]